MSRVKPRFLLRWGLTTILGAASLFFLFAGFSTAVLGEGAEPGELRQAWNFHAAFQFEFAMMFWLASVVIFISLRPGGFLRVVRGQQINPFKRWLYIASLIASLAAFLLSNPAVLITQLEIHRCMKKGGKWVYSTTGCKFGK